MFDTSVLPHTFIPPTQHKTQAPIQSLTQDIRDNTRETGWAWGWEINRKDEDEHKKKHWSGVDNDRRQSSVFHSAFLDCKSLITFIQAHNTVLHQHYINSNALWEYWRGHEGEIWTWEFKFTCCSFFIALQLSMARPTGQKVRKLKCVTQIQSTLTFENLKTIWSICFSRCFFYWGTGILRCLLRNVSSKRMRGQFYER